MKLWMHRYMLVRKKKMKKSSTEFKQMQRERIKRTKPWLKSSGPKTIEGKEISKMNALKISPDLYTLMTEFKKLMAQQKDICKTFKPLKVNI